MGEASRIFLDKRRSLYEFDWQLLRVTLDFSTLSTTMVSIERLKAYLAKHNYRPRAVYKVINLTAAVAMGFNSPPSKKKRDITDMLRIVQTFRESITTEEYLKCKDLTEWHLDTEERQSSLRSASSKDIHLVKQDLTKRWVSYLKRDIQKAHTRPELLEYINMLEEELKRRAHCSLTY